MDGPGNHSRREVAETYDHIASHFSKTREYAWPEVEEFVADQPRASLALDLGCGNGRHAEVLATRTDRVVGLDASRELLGEASTRADERDFPVDLMVGDASNLPLRDSVVDLAVYVATLHHLPTRDDRVRSLDELARVLAPNGRALVSVWSTTHDKFDAEEGFDTTVDWTLPGGVTVPRYYHIYDPEEFHADLDASGLATVDFEMSSGNCYAEVRPDLHSKQ